MKKKWVEIREGYIVEVSGIRSVSSGDHTGTDVAEGNSLFIRFVGDRTATRVAFKTIDEKQVGYQKLRDALQELSEPAPKK